MSQLVYCKKSVSTFITQVCAVVHMPSLNFGTSLDGQAVITTERKIVDGFEELCKLNQLGGNGL